MIDRLLAVLHGTSFHRGLALGALVGAAIAGSTIWQRRHGRATLAASPESASRPPAEPPAA
jgi:hypothetical protein